MRAGLTASVIGHALLLAWGLWQLPGAKPFEVEPIDALPVDLVPIADVTKIAEGSKTAPKNDNASQAKVQTPAPRPDSRRAGAAPTDQDTPITEKATQTAAAKEAEPPPPPPKAAEPPQEKPVEKPPETPPAPPPPKEPAPEKPAPEKPADKPVEKPVEKPPEKAPVAPPKADTGEIAAKPDKPEPPKPEPPKPEPPRPDKPQPDKPEPDKPAEDAPKPAPPAPSTLPPSKPKPPAPAPVETADATPSDVPNRKDSKTPPAKTSKPSDSKSEKFDPNQLAALLNKVDPSGGGGKASPKEASLGSENATGPVANMTQSELDALTAAVTQCFNPPIGAEGIDQMVVPLRVEFTIDGELAGPPTVKAVPGGPVGRAVADAAVRAVQRCAPYPFLPRDKFATWQVVNMNFTPPSSY